MIKKFANVLQDSNCERFAVINVKCMYVCMYVIRNGRREKKKFLEQLFNEIRWINWIKEAVEKSEKKRELTKINKVVILV